MIPITIHGAAGRMGRRLVALTLEAPDRELEAAIDAPGAPSVGRDADLDGAGRSGILIGEAPAGTGVVIDFSVPAAMRSILAHCREAGRPLVIGTTGMDEEDEAAIDTAAATIPVLQAPNMSLGVNLLFALAGEVAARLGDDYDIEVVEAHHRFKKDAPSGTAMGIARAICEATGKSPEETLDHGRHGEHVPRARGRIGMHALRLGDVVGRHEVHFATLGESLTLTHEASDRDIFARGALRAAQWLRGRPAGRYSMKDVLGMGADEQDRT